MEFKPESLLPQLLLGLVGDAEAVIKKADNWDSATQWRWWQNTQAAGAAFATGVVPFPYVLASTPASMLFTYRKMAHVAWGIGHDLDVRIDPLDDVLLITGMWIGAIKKSSLTAVRFSTPILATVFTSLTMASVQTAARGVEERTVKKIIEKAFPGLTKQFAITIGKEGGKQLPIRLVPILGGVISSGMTLASMTSFSRSASVFYAEKRRILGTTS